MDVTPFMFVLLMLAAFVAGLIDSIAGGGGLITTPALLAAGLPPALALGTNKLQSTLGTSASVIRYGAGRHIIWKVAIAGIPAALIGSAVGALVATWVSPIFLGRAIILCLPPAFAFLVFSHRIVRSVSHQNMSQAEFAVVTVGVCTLVGFYDGMIGPGTGTIFIIALTLVCRLSLLESSATAKVFNLASNIGGLIAFSWGGECKYHFGIGYGPGQYRREFNRQQPRHSAWKCVYPENDCRCVGTSLYLLDMEVFFCTNQWCLSRTQVMAPKNCRWSSQQGSP